MIVEILMYGDGHVMTNAEHSSKSVCTQTHMSVLTHILKRLSFLLHRIVCTTSAKHLNLSGLNFNTLSCTLAFNQCTLYAQASTCCDKFEHLCIKLFHISNNLYILYGTTIIQGNKVN